jgi:hypothetical protein
MQEVELKLLLSKDDRVWGLTTAQIRRLIEREQEGGGWRKCEDESPPKGIDCLILCREHWFPDWGVYLSDGWHTTAEKGERVPVYWMPMTVLPDLPEEPNDD